MNPIAATLPIVFGLGLAATALAMALTPAVIRWVRRIGFVDAPTNPMRSSTGFPLTRKSPPSAAKATG